METRTCPHCGTQDYGTPFCVSCQRPFVRDQGQAPTGGDKTPQENLSGFTRRLFAFTFDVILLSLIAELVRFSFQAGSGDRAAQAGFDVPALISFVLIILYFTLFTADGGQTPGKKLLGIKVVRQDGGDPSPRAAFFRAAAYILSGFFGTFLGFLWALWDRRRQTWHDKIARTVVVKSR